MYAIELQRFEMFERLLEMGADVNCGDILGGDKDRVRPLMYAVQKCPRTVFPRRCCRPLPLPLPHSTKTFAYVYAALRSLPKLYD